MYLAGLCNDLREALRRIRRNPRTSLVAAGTMALGIGAAAAVFTIAHSYLMAPPPFREPDRIVSVYGWRESRGRMGVSGADFLDFVNEPNLFELGSLVDYGEFSWTGQSLPGFDGAEVLRGYEVTTGYFRVMDHPMAAGRGFLPGEEHSVVISYALWQRRFGGRGDLIGQTITLNGKPHVVVGVAGRGFVTYSRYEVVAWVLWVRQRRPAGSPPAAPRAWTPPRPCDRKSEGRETAPTGRVPSESRPPSGRRGAARGRSGCPR
jgi:hypothetical protein